MIRPILTELALFLAPFAAYAVFLVMTRGGLLEPDSWSLKTVASLTIVALLLVVGSFVVLAHFTGAPPGSAYVPAHIENGRLVPGETK
jgi:hypothetical protein